LTSLVFAAGANAQRDLTGRDVSIEEMVEALTPAVIPPKARGLTPCRELQAQTSRGIKVEPIAEPLALTIEFHLDSAQLTDQARDALDKVAAALGSRSLDGYCFRIEGHTCDLGTDEHNLSLSSRRAQAAKDYLISRGVDAQRVMVMGFGETAPMVDNASEDLRRKNRRVQISNLGTGQ
jgi:OOP family OmpA-OmpF porin